MRATYRDALLRNQWEAHIFQAKVQKAPKGIFSSFFHYFFGLFPYIWPLAGPNIAKRGWPWQTLARVDRQTHFGTFNFVIKPEFSSKKQKKTIFYRFFDPKKWHFWGSFLTHFSTHFLSIFGPVLDPPKGGSGPPFWGSKTGLKRPKNGPHGRFGPENGPRWIAATWFWASRGCVGQTRILAFLDRFRPIFCRNFEHFLLYESQEKWKNRRTAGTRPLGHFNIRFS